MRRGPSTGAGRWRSAYLARAVDVPAEVTVRTGGGESPALAEALPDPASVAG